ncbi:hypothetical protein LEP1GSC016_1526 [Leptospira borgpetersenii serovar Hardjo-bovis str. Sponselee]|uniref:Uncharacterized protein n=1 Tax=Leptospira borgpetersenii serovar Hardjo-bovis str. Sponselee TaxID=1303729 RepID=M6C3N6_LEPBO|nr:hypothetical protein LEP1GSC016_1526 [Leptospira borgpetersenii serovar Hardjo-bovis str. Sponselee]
MELTEQNDNSKITDERSEQSSRSTDPRNFSGQKIGGYFF